MSLQTEHTCVTCFECVHKCMCACHTKLWFVCISSAKNLKLLIPTATNNLSSDD